MATQYNKRLILSNSADDEMQRSDNKREAVKAFQCSTTPSYDCLQKYLRLATISNCWSKRAVGLTFCQLLFNLRRAVIVAIRQWEMASGNQVCRFVYQQHVESCPNCSLNSFEHPLGLDPCYKTKGQHIDPYYYCW